MSDGTADDAASLNAFDAEVIQRRREIANLELDLSRKREIQKAIKTNCRKAEDARTRAVRNGGFDSIADRDAFSLKKQLYRLGQSIQRIEREIVERRSDLREVQARAKAQQLAAERENAERRAVRREIAERNQQSVEGMATHRMAIGLTFAIARAVADCDYILAGNLVAQLDEVKPDWRAAPSVKETP